jgi:inorganic phosphate transporter, PiT family
MMALPTLAAIAIAFYLAWNLGANDVANSMGTSVGSKALSLSQAIGIAAIFELSGALLFSHAVSANLITGVIDLDRFADRPQLFISAMLAVLLSAGIWMNLATWLGLPVSSSHATVGALAGVGIVAIDWQAIHWDRLGFISLSWMLTPLVSGLVATLVYRALRSAFLSEQQPNRIQEWIPWLTVGLVLVFGAIVLPSVTDRLQLNLIHHHLSDRTLMLGIGSLMVAGLNLWLLQPPVSDRSPEQILSQFQIISACFVAFAHGSNDVGNAIAPLAAIVQITATGNLPIAGLALPFWVLSIGGLGIVAGLAVWGRNVMATIGEGIIPLKPSGGFAAEIATAITILLASRFGLSLSTSHALVGAVVGVGLAQPGLKIQTSVLKSIALSWLATIPLAAIVAAIAFRLLTAIAQITTPAG